MSYESALRAIAGMKVDEDTDHAQLSALCIAIAVVELAQDDADYPEES